MWERTWGNIVYSHLSGSSKVSLFWTLAGGLAHLLLVGLEHSKGGFLNNVVSESAGYGVGFSCFDYYSA